jgi:hypothetical protein
VSIPRWTRARVAHVASDDRIVLLPLAGAATAAEAVALSGVGRMVWDLLAEPRTTSELVDALRTIWPDAGITADDLTGFLGDMAAAGVVHAVS